MKKNLNVTAAVLDLRKVSEETFASYEDIKLQAALVLTTPRVEALLAKYPVEMEAAVSQSCGEDTVVSIVNGKSSLSAAHKPEKDTILMVNGKLTIAVDAADTLRSYNKIIINGKAVCPESLTAVVNEKAMVNGKLSVYPDEAVVLNGTVKLDKSFLIRAQDRLYWTEKQFVAVDAKLDVDALAAKGTRFAAPKAVIAEPLAEKLVPLFTENTELVILPEGAAFVDDDLKLTPAALRRYGSKLYVTGDVNSPAESAGVLEKVEYLHVGGDVTITAAAEDAFYAISDTDYKELRVLKGRLVNDMPMVRITPEMLDIDPDGVSCTDCALVTLDKALTAEEIVEKLRISDCACIRCTMAQEAAVSAVSTDVAQIKVTDAPEERDDGETVRRMGAQLTL